MMLITTDHEARQDREASVFAHFAHFVVPVGGAE